MNNEIVSIHIAPRAEAPMETVNLVEAVEGRGLSGDRYFKGKGTFSDTVEAPSFEVTLVEREMLEAFNKRSGHNLAPGDLRRNIVTQGVSLNQLVGKTFRVGDVVLRGTRLCEPCNHLATIVHKDVLSMVHQAGLRAGIVKSGTIRVGDSVSILLEETV